MLESINACRREYKDPRYCAYDACMGAAATGCVEATMVATTTVHWDKLSPQETDIAQRQLQALHAVHNNEPATDDKFVLPPWQDYNQTPTDLRELFTSALGPEFWQTVHTFNTTYVECAFQANMSLVHTNPQMFFQTEQSPDSKPYMLDGCANLEECRSRCAKPAGIKGPNWPLIWKVMGGIIGGVLATAVLAGLFHRSRSTRIKKRASGDETAFRPARELPSSTYQAPSVESTAEEPPKPITVVPVESATSTVEDEAKPVVTVPVESATATVEDEAKPATIVPVQIVSRTPTGAL